MVSGGVQARALRPAVITSHQYAAQSVVSAGTSTSRMEPGMQPADEPDQRRAGEEAEEELHPAVGLAPDPGHVEADPGPERRVLGRDVAPAGSAPAKARRGSRGTSPARRPGRCSARHRSPPGSPRIAPSRPARLCSCARAVRRSARAVRSCGLLGLGEPRASQRLELPHRRLHLADLLLQLQPRPVRLAVVRGRTGDEAVRAEGQCLHAVVEVLGPLGDLLSPGLLGVLRRSRSVRLLRGAAVGLADRRLGPGDRPRRELGGQLGPLAGRGLGDLRSPRSRSPLATTSSLGPWSSLPPPPGGLVGLLVVVVVLVVVSLDLAAATGPPPAWSQPVRVTQALCWPKQARPAGPSPRTSWPE